MSEYLSKRQRKLNVGITSYTENQLVLDVTGNANISGDVGIGRSVYDSLNSSGESDNVLSSSPTGVIWKKSGIGIGTVLNDPNLIGIGITVINFFGSKVSVDVTNNVSNVEIDDIFPIGDYGDFTQIYDAFGIALDITFDCLTQPSNTLSNIDLGTL